MPLLRKPVLMPIVGLDYMNPSTMINDRGGFPKNMRLSRNDLRKREGKTLFQTGAMSGAARVMNLATYPLTSQAIRIIRFSKVGAEKYNSDTGAWDDITGAAFTGSDDDFFSATVAENKIIVTNGVDAIRTHDDDTDFTDLVASSGSVPKTKFLEYNGGYLLAAYTTKAGETYPTGIDWTDINDITAWGSGNYGSTLLHHDPLPIRGLKNLNEYTIAYKKNSIYAGRKVDTSDIFIWDLLYTGIGLMASRALVDFRGSHYFMGTDDFYIFNGIKPESIGDQTVKREVFSRLDGTYQTRSFAVHVTEMDEVWFFIVTSGNTWPTEIWKYNYRTGYWYFDTCDQITAAIAYYSAASVSWNSLVGSWNSQTWRWDDKLASAESPIIIFGDSSGNTLKQDTLVNNDNGSAIDGEWQSMDFVGSDKFENYSRWLQLDFEAKGNSVDIAYSTDYGSTWHTIKTNYTLTSNWPSKMYRIYFDVVARNIRFRLRNNRPGETFSLRQLYPFYLQREECNR